MHFIDPAIFDCLCDAFGVKISCDAVCLRETLLEVARITGKIVAHAENALRLEVIKQSVAGGEHAIMPLRVGEAGVKCPRPVMPRKFLVEDLAFGTEVSRTVQRYKESIGKF